MFRLTPQAEQDIDQIAEHISLDNPTAALRWSDNLLEKCRRIGDMPRMGIARPEIRPGLRTMFFGNYMIVYREVDRGVEIVRVLHGARKWEDLL